MLAESGAYFFTCLRGSPASLAASQKSFFLKENNRISVVPISGNKKLRTDRSGVFGGDEGDRTPYLLNAIQALSQVSYTPILSVQKISDIFISIAT